MMPATTKRRSTLDRRDREFIATTVLSAYIKATLDDIAVMQSADLPEPVRERLIWQFEAQLEQAKEIAAKLSGSDTEEDA
jgi:hypothetical protein